MPQPDAYVRAVAEKSAEERATVRVTMLRAAAQSLTPMPPPEVTAAARDRHNTNGTGEPAQNQTYAAPGWGLMPNESACAAR